MASKKGPKRLSSPVSTSGEGGHFESRVQASYLLALLSGDDSRFLAHSQITEMRFQGRIHGFNTDDLICTVERDDGSTFKVAMQVKLTLKARVSDTPFKDSITDAWHDYDAGAQFKRDVDRIVIVYSRDSGTGTVYAASQVCAKARAAANSADFLRAALSEGYSSRDQRDALAAIAGRSCSPSWSLISTSHVAQRGVAQPRMCELVCVRMSVQLGESRCAALSSTGFRSKDQGTASSQRHDAGGLGRPLRPVSHVHEPDRNRQGQPDADHDSRAGRQRWRACSGAV